MQLRTLLAGSALAAGLVSAAPAAQAAQITIANPGFDAATIADGSTGSATSWSAASGTSAGVALNPSTSQLTGGTAKDGNNVGNLAPGQSLTQSLSTNYAANTTYTLTFYVAERLDISFAGYDARVFVNGTSVAEALSATTPTGTTRGSFSNAINLIWTSPSTVTAGQPLVLDFRPTATSGTVRTVIDAVSMTSAAPEPATAGLMGMAAMGLLARRRRSV